MYSIVYALKDSIITFETFEVSIKIHGGKTKDSKPAAAGLVNVLETKFSRKTLSSLISRKRKLCT